MKTVALEPEYKPLMPCLLDTELSYYRRYPWSLNSLLTVREVVDHLQEELCLPDQLEEDWHYNEVMTNVFLLSCTLSAAVEDFLSGSVYEFTKAARILPVLRPALKFVDRLQVASLELRAWRLHPLHRWKDKWEAALHEFLRLFVAEGPRDRKALAQSMAQLASLLSGGFSDELQRQRPKVPGAFRSKDLTHFDILRLGEKFSAAFPDPQQHVAVIGLRTAGSFFAAVFRAFLHQKGYQNLSCVTLRPKSDVAPWEAARLASSARDGALAVVVDEHPNTGVTFGKTLDLLRRTGFDDSKVIFLFPVHPAHPDWRDVLQSQGLSRIRVLYLEPKEWYKHQLLSPEAVERRLNEYFRACHYRSACLLPSPAAERLNAQLQDLSDDKVLTRLKRVYEVRLETQAGGSETRYVLAKSVGWGWWGYHAFLASERLTKFTPPVLGLRDGILYMEWLPQANHARELNHDRNRLVGFVASYIATRTRTLSIGKDPTPDLSRQGQHQGYRILSDVLGRAYGRGAALKRGYIRVEASREPCPFPTLIDGRMARREWIKWSSCVLKTDFEHHGQGKTELNMTDPAYDLAEAIFHLDLLPAEESDLIDRYIKESGDTAVAQRIFLSKLLAGEWELQVTLSRLNDDQFAHREQEFHERYIKAWNFLTLHTMRFCASFCRRPDTLYWHTPVVFLDIDGVLDRRIFGFPSTTAAGIQAVSLLHAHDFAVAINSARSLHEVKEYCQAYGFVGGVAEYGSVVWDGLRGREFVLVDPESLAQLETLKRSLHATPGVFLDTSYQHSIRSFTYENRGRVPLPRSLIQDLLLRLKLDRLYYHQTSVDTAILAKGIDKGSGLRGLLKWVGVSELDPVAVGDSESDLPMFHHSKRCFAPAQMSARQEAKRLGCQIVDRPFQTGLLSIAYALAHPDGGRCERCRSCGVPWTKGKSVFLDALEAADQKPIALALKAVLHPTAVEAFAKK